MGEIETEEQRTRAEIARYFRNFVDKLDSAGEVTLDLGEQRVTFDPTEPITFEREGESAWSEGDPAAKQSIEFELGWWRDTQTTEEGT